MTSINYLQMILKKHNVSDAMDSMVHFNLLRNKNKFDILSISTKCTYNKNLFTGRLQVNKK